MDELKSHLTFNRGVVSAEAIARADLSRLNGSAEIMENWIPRVLGSMTFRPGFGFIGESPDEGALIEFIFSDTDTAILDLTPNILKIWENGSSLLTRPGVTATVANGDFNADLTGWTDSSDAGGSTNWETGGFLAISGNGTDAGRIYQSVTPDPAEVGVEHSLRIVVERGPVVLRIGTTNGADDVFRQAVLRKGVHSIAFSPTSTFFIEFSSPLTYSIWIEECSLELAGSVTLPTPWSTPEECRLVDYQTSNDVMFCANGNYRQRRISRREGRSWSIAEYIPRDGPFDTQNTEQITVTPSATTGQVTLTASKGIFRQELVGSTFQVIHASTFGVVYISSFVSDTVVNAYVLRTLGGTTATQDWAQSLWSDFLGWPTATAIWEGRIWWFRTGSVTGSVSDGFDNFDQQVEGDSGPIVKGFGTGYAQNPKWAIGGVRLLVGTDHAEFTIRSTAFREPVTPTNYNVIPDTAEGSLDVLPVNVKNRVAFVDRSGQSTYEVSFDLTTEATDSLHLNVLALEILNSGVRRIGSQRKPDERIWYVLNNGTVAVLVRDPVEQVRAWCIIKTDGFIEDVCFVPVKNQFEDDVFIKVKRTIDGNEVRYMEKMALLSECIGGNLNFVMDSFLSGTGDITGLAHLEGKEVVIWADGEDRGIATVVNGSIPQTYDNWCAGLSYEGLFKSSMLVWELDNDYFFGDVAAITHVSLVLRNTHSSGLTFGPNFDEMDSLPAVEEAQVISPQTYELYSKQKIEFPGDMVTDPRFCLRAQSPYNATVMASSLLVKRSL